MRLAAAHFEIAVAAAKRIEKFFFVAVVRKAHAIVQLIEATEACGLDFRKLCVGGVFFENIVEHLGVIERFRDGDAELFFAAAVCTDMEEDEQIQHGARNDREEHGERDIAAAAGETHGHGNEDDGDVFGVTGCGAETDKAERAGDRDARADVAVDEHNDGLHGKRQQNDSEYKALRKACAARIRKRDECAAKQRDERAKQKRRYGDTGRGEACKHGFHGNILSEIK